MLHTLKKWEKVVLAVALAIALMISMVLVSGYSFYPWFFELQDPIRNDRSKIGEIKQMNGNVRKQELNGDLFKPIQKGAQLYNDDFLTTGNGSSAQIILNDGSKIELGPNTMVKIALQSQFSFKGLSRALNIDVVSGTVKANPKGMLAFLKNSLGEVKKVEEGAVQSIDLRNEPKVLAEAFGKILAANVDTPEVIQPQSVQVESNAAPQNRREFNDVVRNTLKITTPLEGAVFTLAPYAEKLVVPIEIKGVVNTPRVEYRIRLLEIDSGGNEKTLYDRALKPEANAISIPIFLDHPGQYRIEGGREMVSFQVKPDFIGIKPLPYSLTETGMNLQWKKLPMARNYTVDAVDDRNREEKVFNKVTRDTQVFIEKNKILKPFAYQVSAEFDSGFRATSAFQKIGVTLLPPLLVSPSDQAKVSMAKNTLLTWKQMPFVDEYELEIYDNAELTQQVLRKLTRENYHYFRAPRSGMFYWRVRSVIAEQKGSYSNASSFEAITLELKPETKPKRN